MMLNVNDDVSRLQLWEIKIHPNYITCRVFNLQNIYIYKYIYTYVYIILYQMLYSVVTASEGCSTERVNTISHPFFLGVDRMSESGWWLLSGFDRSVDDM